MLHHMFERYRAARKNNESGFTLIELLIVIIILGVLAGIVVFSVSFIKTRGENAACKTDKKNVEAAVEAYYSQFGEYPAAVDGAADSTTLVGKSVLKEAPPISEGIVYTFVPAAGGNPATYTLTAPGSCA